MTKLELEIIHELVERKISKKNLNKIIESIYKKASKENLSAKEATTLWFKEERNNHKYEAIYLPYNSKGKNSPETVASQLKVFFAPDDFTALTYAIALVSADREEYFKNEKNITKKEALNYVNDFLYPEAFPYAMGKSQITLTSLYDMLQYSQNDDGTGESEPETDYGYLFSLIDAKGSYIYKGDLNPHDWNYESFTWWHDGELSDKYSAYVDQDEDIIEDHLPKKRF